MTEFSAQQFEVYPDGMGEHFWMRARHRIVLRKLRRLPDAGRILDVGCGRGISTEYLLRHGLDILGCDLGSPDPYSAEIAPRIAYRTSAFDLPADVRNSISTVLLLDVIEHIDGREEWLKRLAASYPNLRHVVFTVPARNELWSNYDDYYGHFIRFDRRSMAELAKRSSFALVRQEYFFHALYLPMWWTARIAGKRNLRPGAPPSGIWRAVHRLIAWCFTVEERIIPGAVPGGSMLAVFARDLR